MSITSFSPSKTYAQFSSVVFPVKTPTLKILTTAGGAVTLTAAEVLCGLLNIECQDAQTATTPTAAAIVAAINGCMVGTSFDLDIVNYGDTTLTIALGTGVTKITSTTTSVLTLATTVSKRFTFVVTNTTPGSEAVSIYGVGGGAAVVA